MEGECPSIDVNLAHQKQIDLLPFTSDEAAINKWERAARSHGLTYKVLDAGRPLIAETEDLRLRLGKWACATDRGDGRGVPLREQFMFPEGGVSGWWFSLLSERNPLKTDVFLKIAQLQVVDRLVSSGTYRQVVYTGPRRNFRTAIHRLCHRHGVLDKSEIVPGVSPLSVREQVRRSVDSFGGVGDVVLAVVALVRFWRRGRLFRRHLGPVQKRPIKKGALLFTGVFPAVDPAQALKGIHASRFFGPLQKVVLGSGIPIQWLLLWIPSQEWSLEEAAKLAGTFVKKGEVLFFMEEFFTLSVFLQCLRAWARSCWRYFTLVARNDGLMTSGGILLPEAGLLLKPVSRVSFVGNVAISGIMYYYCFRRALRCVGTSSTRLIYHAEMQAWEKALNAAKSEICPTLMSIGFQHTAVPPQFFSYFLSPEETIRTGRKSDVPLPDILACNGDIPLEALSKSGYPRLEVVEALRHLPLSRVLREPIPRKTVPWSLLLVGSIDARETGVLSTILENAFPGGCPFLLWFKPHPAMGHGPLSVRLQKSLERLSARIRGESMETLLSQSAAVLVGSSSLSVEALAYGCRVIIPNFGDILPINALEGRTDLCDRPTTAGELRSVLEGLRVEGDPLSYAQKGREYVKKYWALEEDLPRWRRLLDLSYCSCPSLGR